VGALLTLFRRAAAGSSPPAPELSFEDDIILWYRADDVNLALTKITQFNDKSASGYDSTNPDTAKRATLVDVPPEVARCNADAFYQIVSAMGNFTASDFTIAIIRKKYILHSSIPDYD